MKRIYKYPLEFVDGPQDIEVPACSHIRFVGVQNGVPCLWIEGETDTTSVVRYFVIHGTSHDIAPNECWLGTCQDRQFVWHFFEAV